MRTVCLRCGFDGDVCACVAISEGWEDGWVQNRIGHILYKRAQKKREAIAEIQRNQPLIRASFRRIRELRETME